MFKPGDKVKIKKGVDTSLWHQDFVRYCLSNKYVVVDNYYDSRNAFFYIANWGNVQCEYFELVSRRKEKLRLP
jgi:hypothetical protein